MNMITQVAGHIPKLGELLRVKSARTQAVMKDHMAKNFLDLSSKQVATYSSVSYEERKKGQTPRNNAVLSELTYNVTE